MWSLWHLLNSAIVRAAMDNTKVNGHGYIPINFYLQKQEVGQIWPWATVCWSKQIGLHYSQVIRCP